MRQIRGLNKRVISTFIMSEKTYSSFMGFFDELNMFIPIGGNVQQLVMILVFSQEGV